MNTNQWESSYQQAIDTIHVPSHLDEKVMEGLRNIRPEQQIRSAHGGASMLSKVGSGLGIVAVAIVLLHPAQYIGAEPGQVTPGQAEKVKSAEEQLARKAPASAAIPSVLDEWYHMRAEIQAGNYMSLCAQWRRQQGGDNNTRLPKDLATKAKQHCRLLP
ncbi:hypothetical protein KUV22_00450 [Microbulbifer agarilyticus]|uniref:hypothetical protein n=1 Tax=Microbulbifer agarilyticus TaxID=260552 RepID=UPI001C96D4A6|nr:hypothetical protein [Microbulbifer agarilyticus]MBY6188888.1 hypothetical protein [Microbulbifer agarilyticus]